MKSALGLLVAAIVLARGLTAADRGATDLWIGVVVYDEPEPGVRVGATSAPAAISPVGALIGGKWSFVESGKGLSEWPPDYKVPQKWFARLWSGTARVAGTSGPEHVSNDRWVVTSSLQLPVSTQGLQPLAEGIAWAGDVDIRLFSELYDRREKEEVLRFLTPSMLGAERAELSSRASTENAGEAEKAARMLPPGYLELSPFKADYVKASRQRAGIAVYVVEGVKPMRGCTDLHTGAAARRGPDGRLDVLGAWSYLDCEDVFVAHTPLAAIERGGRTCWLVELGYEDGTDYSLTTPGPIDDYKSACNIK